MNKMIESSGVDIDIVMSKKYNFSSIRCEYVEGYINEDNTQKWPTMKELSLKYGIPHPYLRRIASKEKWTLERNNYINNYEHNKQEEKIKYLAKASAKFDTKCHKIAEEGIRKVENFLCRPLFDNSGNPIVLTIDDLEMAAKVLEKFQKVGRLALGSSTDNISKSIKATKESITLSEGLDIVGQQLESNPDLYKKIELEFIDE